ncbi:hypothetical protein [Streptomyces sp. NPDC000351]|uniref:ATP-dependent DNA ligase n=1 Tax=Streptomyces sp. NPDC000351 TaxID=3154250 RepID=UPI003323B916
MLEAGRALSPWSSFVSAAEQRSDGEGGTDLTPWPYSRRRAALEELFAENGLTAPLTLCPSTTDPDTAREWLTWTSAGLEGLCFKPLRAPYRAGARAWGKYKIRITEDAVVGAVTGPVTAPRTLLLGSYDPAGRLRYTGWTTTLPRTTGPVLAELLTITDAHPWTGRTFSAGWGTREVLTAHLVRPDLVVEVEVDVARDAAGRWRHPARLHRIRAEMHPMQVPKCGEPD